MNKTFYRNLLAITLPVTLQNMISYSVNMMDTLMLGGFGEDVLSAAGLANQVFFLFSLLISGVGTGAAVLCSQYYGKNDIKSVRKIVAIDIKISIAISLLFFAVLFCFPELVMRIFTSEEGAVQAGIGYLKIVCVSYLFFGITNTFLVVLRSLQNVQLSLIIYIISLLVNVLCNYIFIFGKCNMPAMGIEGAAVGTVIARFVEIVILLFYLLKKEQVLRFRLKMLLFWDKVLFRDLMKYGMPVVAGELFWGLGITMHSVILGHMGSAAVAASSICNVLHQFTLSLSQGMGSATCVIIGNFIGAGKEKMALQASRVLMKIFVVTGVITGIVILLISGPFLSFYTLGPQAALLARQFMIVYALLAMFRGFVTPSIAGILWGGGDTKFAFLIDTIFLWVLIPIGAIAAFHYSMAPPVVLSILRCETPIKVVVCYLRIKSGKWLRAITR